MAKLKLIRRPMQGYSCHGCGIDDAQMSDGKLYWDQYTVVNPADRPHHFQTVEPVLPGEAMLLCGHCLADWVELEENPPAHLPDYKTCPACEQTMAPVQFRDDGEGLCRVCQPSPFVADRIRELKEATGQI